MIRLITYITLSFSLLAQHTYSYRSYMDAVSSILSVTVRHAVVTRDTSNIQKREIPSLKWP